MVKSSTKPVLVAQGKTKKIHVSIDIQVVVQRMIDYRKRLCNGTSSIQFCESK